MAVLWLAWFLGTHMVVLGQVHDGGRPFLVPEVQNISEKLISPLKYDSFLTELPSYEDSNTTLYAPEAPGFALLARQTCVNPGYTPCPNNPAACCKAGDNCVVGGCCSAGEQKCNTNGCYNPNTQVCCPDTSLCPFGYFCTDSVCCPAAGERRCGTSDRCYNPAKQNCCEGKGSAWGCPLDQSCCGVGLCYDPTTFICCGDTVCPKGTDCVPGGCCPSGQIRCGAVNCYNPKINKCCVKDGFAWGCLLGGSCCSADSCYEATTQQCCTNGPCFKDETCCEKECCLPNDKCGSDGYCTAKTSSSSSASRTPTPTAPSITKPKLPTTTSLPTSLSTSSQTSCLPTTLPTAATASDPGDYLLVNGKCLPVMDFPYFDGLTEQLVESMCGGIRQQTGSGKLSNSMMVLTTQGFRVATAACRGLCGGKLDPKYKERMECDEFPFGATTEGGRADAHVMCIYWRQNSIQGALIRQYIRFYNIRAGDKFVVRMLPNCDRFGPSAKRDTEGLQRRQDGELTSSNVGNLKVLSSSSSAWQQDLTTGAVNGTGFIFVPFGEVEAGIFDTKLGLQGKPSKLYIIGGDGIEYYSIENPSSTQALSFNISEVDALTIVVPAFQNTTANVSYTCTVSPLVSSTKASGACSVQGRFLAQSFGHVLFVFAVVWEFIW